MSYKKLKTSVLSNVLSFSDEQQQEFEKEDNQDLFSYLKVAENWIKNAKNPNGAAELK